MLYVCKWLPWLSFKFYFIMERRHSVVQRQEHARGALYLSSRQKAEKPGVHVKWVNCKAV